MSDESSELRELREQVRTLSERLIEAQKLTALGELVGTTTHEFNNVLMTIINYAKLGLRHGDRETQQRAFDKILGAAQRAARITGSILGMARNRQPGLEPTDLTRVIEDTLFLLEREMTKHRIKVECRLQPAPHALANGNQMQQVLMNLLINARQAMPQGGRILISLGYEAAGNLVELTVRDTGCGMTPEVAQRIFDPFFSTKRGPDATGRGGTGLGLSTCRQIIEAHHGRIRVETSPGKGTAFTLKIPAAAAAPVVFDSLPSAVSPPNDAPRPAAPAFRPEVT